MKLVFVHGRAQEHKDPVALKKEWIEALAYGLSKTGLKVPIPDDAIALPYYGNALFDLTKNLGQVEKEAIARGGPAADPMLQFEADALLELSAKAGLAESDIQSQFGAAPGARGPENWWWVQAIARALDRWKGGLSAGALKLILRDVYVYTTRGGVAAEIDRIVTADISQEPTVIVSHSLGTVVAYNILRRDPRPLQTPLLVTVGSPLAIRAVRRQLVPLRSPKVGAWFNAFDPADIVALNPLDAENFPVTPAVENKNDVHNFTENRHGIAGYLADPIVARKIYDSLV
jgi:hypothetical protein